MQIARRARYSPTGMKPVPDDLSDAVQSLDIDSVTLRFQPRAHHEMASRGCMVFMFLPILATAIATLTGIVVVLVVMALESTGLWAINDGLVLAWLWPLSMALTALVVGWWVFSPGKAATVRVERGRITITRGAARWVAPLSETQVTVRIGRTIFRHDGEETNVFMDRDRARALHGWLRQLQVDADPARGDASEVPEALHRLRTPRQAE